MLIFIAALALAVIIILKLPCGANRGVSPQFAGPRANVPENSPTDREFRLFSVPVPGVLSRSGQPSPHDFAWLKANGWKSVINLREGIGHAAAADDEKVPGFTELGFKYLRLPFSDDQAPTDAQADHFLSFLGNPENRPAHLHCHMGIGRTGALVAVYRYSVQGWPMRDAIAETKLFGPDLKPVQERWLMQWAKNHAPGEYARQQPPPAQTA